MTISGAGAETCFNPRRLPRIDALSEMAATGNESIYSVTSSGENVMPLIPPLPVLIAVCSPNRRGQLWLLLEGGGASPADIMWCIEYSVCDLY